MSGHACRVQPGHVPALKALGSVFFDRSQPGEAIDAWQKALAHAPRDAELHNDLGNAYRQLERQDETIASYRQALEINDNVVQGLVAAVYALDQGAVSGSAEPSRCRHVRATRSNRVRVRAIPRVHDGRGARGDCWRA